ncbi:PEP-CTERM sorting domain-containing protein [Candidatus Saccharibacteria bacterium]|nr:PEP-CTERM sorting domain-containing protein [Phycisphaerae bacterium]NIV97917.1 PEP-CTERM sorting domain-containing protein [Candidatus Saccharibacteria bacterium]
MMRKITLILGVGVVILACRIVEAGIVSFDCQFPDDPYGYYHDWGYDFLNDELTLTENLFGKPPSEGDQVVMSGETDGSTTFTVIKTITNTTGTTWTGYDLELLSTGTFVDGTAGCTKFGTHSFSEDFKTLHFYAPLSVYNTEAVTLQVDINIPTTGLFEFTMAQHPLPEPAMLLLFGLGAMMLRKRKDLK